MQLAMLKSLAELEAASKELKKRAGKNRNFINYIRDYFFVFSQLGTNCGWTRRTSTGRRDSTRGRTGRRWTLRRGTRDSRKCLAQEKRLACFCTRATPNYGTGAAAALLSSSANCPPLFPPAIKFLPSKCWPGFIFKYRDAKFRFLLIKKLFAAFI